MKRLLVVGGGLLGVALLLSPAFMKPTTPSRRQIEHDRILTLGRPIISNIHVFVTTHSEAKTWPIDAYARAGVITPSERDFLTNSFVVVTNGQGEITQYIFRDAYKPDATRAH